MTELKEELIRDIGRHAESTYPEECCGILLGDNAGSDVHVSQIVRIDNSQDENRKRRFLITPKQYLEAEKTAAERKMDLLGFYHSHPDHPAIPSAYDTQHALPSFVYLIMSVKSGRPDEITAWKLSETRERFVKEDLQTREPRKSHADTSDAPV